VALSTPMRLCYAFLVLVLLASCRDKVICPTFQSTYILDDSVRNVYFSYLWYLSEEERKAYASRPKVPPPDTTGVVASAKPEAQVDYFDYTAEYKVPVRGTKKNKYGIVQRPMVMSYTVQNLRMKSSPMRDVKTPPKPAVDDKEDSGMPMDSTALASLDSTAVKTDSLAAKPLAKKKPDWKPFLYDFNPYDSMQPDQENYFREFGWLLQNRAPRPGEGDVDEQPEEKKGFFKRLLGTKKGEEESADAAPSQLSEEDELFNWEENEQQGEESESGKKKSKPAKATKTGKASKEPKGKKPKKIKAEDMKGAEGEEDDDGGF
jgi:hypothetical protein